MATRRCTCGFTEFFERKAREELTSLRWARFAETYAGGFGSGPLGSFALGTGEPGGSVVVWAKIEVDRTLVRLEVVCRSCGRVRSAKTLGGAGLVGSYIRSGMLYVVVSDLIDVGCYSVEFRGVFHTYTVQLKRSYDTPEPIGSLVPLEQTLETPPTDRAETLLYAQVPADARYPGTYEMVLVDRCAQTETSLGTTTLEDNEAMLIPLQTAEYDAPSVMLKPSGFTLADVTDTLRYGGLGPAPYSLPFDKCLGVAEYDARLGTLPTVQGWTENNPGAGLYAIANATLINSQPNGSQNNYGGMAVAAATPPQAYGYAALRTPYLGRGEVVLSIGDGAGVRHAQVFESNTGPVHEVVGNSPVIPALECRENWTKLGIFRAENYATITTDRDTSPLYIPVDPTAPYVSASPFAALRIGSSDLAGGGGITLYRYACVSYPGRFVRYYFRGHSSVVNPTLRLYLSASPYTGSNTARFKVCYDVGTANPMGKPSMEVGATQAFLTADYIYELPITLAGVGAGPVWFSVERAWDHAEDLLDATINLHQMTLRSA